MQFPPADGRAAYSTGLTQQQTRPRKVGWEGGRAKLGEEAETEEVRGGEGGEGKGKAGNKRRRQRNGACWAYRRQGQKQGEGRLEMRHLVQLYFT